MKIETKYDIGQKVWIHWHGLPLACVVDSIAMDQTKVCRYVLRGKDPGLQLLLTGCKENEIFPTNESLMNFLNGTEGSSAPVTNETKGGGDPTENPCCRNGGWVEITPANMEEVYANKHRIVLKRPGAHCHIYTAREFSKEMFRIYAEIGHCYYYVIPE